jgi:MerR-like DNA binding protein
MRGGPKAIYKCVAFYYTFSCIQSEAGLLFKLDSKHRSIGICHGHGPQHEAGSGLHHSAPNGHADSEPEAEANSRLSTIREMARDFQVSIRALRFYEDRGLLHPRRESTSGTMPATGFISR